MIKIDEQEKRMLLSILQDAAKGMVSIIDAGSIDGDDVVFSIGVPGQSDMTPAEAMLFSSTIKNVSILTDKINAMDFAVVSSHFPYNSNDGSFDKIKKELFDMILEK